MQLLVLFITFFVLLSCNNNSKHEHPAPPPVYVYPEPQQEPPPIKTPPRPGFITLDNIENTILLDLQSLPSDDSRLAARYLISCDRFNLGEDLDEFVQGVNRGINMLSTARFIEAVTPIGNGDCIYRIDLDDYDIDFGTADSDWTLIEDSMLLDFISLTVRNQNIQFLTQTAKPYVIATDFYVATFEGDAIASKGCTVYCTIIDQPVDLDDFFAVQGVNVQQEADEENLIFSAFSQSQIALQKDRGVQIVESDNGYIMTTYDSALGGDSFFENPFTQEIAGAGGIVRSAKVFQFDAQEHIATLANGMLMFRLNGAAGLAESAAPNDVVIDINQADIDPTIYLGSCANCHYQAAIPFRDELGRHLRTSPSFDEDEALLGEVFFDYNSISAILDKINRVNSQVNLELGIVAGSDPLTNVIMKPLRKEMSIEQVASMTFLTTEQFKERLEGTQVTRQVFGNLLNDGGKVSLAILSQNFGVMVDEMRLFQDDEL